VGPARPLDGALRPHGVGHQVADGLDAIGARAQHAGLAARPLVVDEQVPQAAGVVGEEGVAVGGDPSRRASATAYDPFPPSDSTRPPGPPTRPAGARPSAAAAAYWRAVVTWSGSSRRATSASAPLANWHGTSAIDTRASPSARRQASSTGRTQVESSPGPLLVRTTSRPGTRSPARHEAEPAPPRPGHERPQLADLGPARRQLVQRLVVVVADRPQRLSSARYRSPATPCRRRPTALRR
jgi:hypothetical protein